MKQSQSALRTVRDYRIFSVRSLEESPAPIAAGSAAGSAAGRIFEREFL